MWPLGVLSPLWCPRWTPRLLLQVQRGTGLGAVLAVHGPLPAQQHPPAPRAALPAVPQALPTRRRLPAAAAESPKVRTHARTHARGRAQGVRKALGWAAGRMGLWDKSLGDKGMTTRSSQGLSLGYHSCQRNKGCSAQCPFWTQLQSLAAQQGLAHTVKSAGEAPLRGGCWCHSIVQKSNWRL